MKPHSLSPDWAISCMQRINRFEDPDVLEATLELLVAVADLEGTKGDCAKAALDFGYRQTEDCQSHCEEYLGLAS